MKIAILFATSTLLLAFLGQAKSAPLEDVTVATTAAKKDARVGVEGFNIEDDAIDEEFTVSPYDDIADGIDDEDDDEDSGNPMDLEDAPMEWPVVYENRPRDVGGVGLGELGIATFGEVPSMKETLSELEQEQEELVREAKLVRKSPSKVYHLPFNFVFNFSDKDFKN